MLFDTSQNKCDQIVSECDIPLTTGKFYVLNTFEKKKPFLFELKCLHRNKAYH